MCKKCEVFKVFYTFWKISECFASNYYFLKLFYHLIFARLNLIKPSNGFFLKKKPYKSSDMVFNLEN